MDGPQVGDGMARVDLPLVVLHKLRRAAGDGAVVHMDGNDGWMVVVACMEYSGVCIANAETKVSEGTFERVVPLSPGLLEPIKGLLEVFDGVVVFIVARRVLHIDIFIFPQLPVEICSIKVEAIDVPILVRSKREDGAK